MTDTLQPVEARPPRTPRLAGGVELLGPMEETGYEVPPALVRRGDGQTLQVTPLLFLVLQAIDGRRDDAAIAEHVTERAGKRVAADDVRYLIEEKLQPLGVFLRPDGSEEPVEKVNPLLALRFRVVVSNPEVTRKITAPFAVLFQP